MTAQSPIYLGSILLEPNRWTAAKKPSYRLSEWLPRIREAGFDGIELWENHYEKADATEQSALRAAVGYFPLFNTYAGMDASPAASKARAAATATIRALGSRAVKFNVGKEMTRLPEYQETVRKWTADLPPESRPLCECHAGTALETPEAAAKSFQYWNEARFGAIVHAFSIPPQQLEDWLKRLGPRVTHIHVQILDERGKRVRLDRRPQEARTALRLLKDYGFSGSFTLEFTEGTGTADDTPEKLFSNAKADLAFLKEYGG